jgi:predicted heme/steroid binding protein
VNSFLLPNNKLHLFSGTELLKKLCLAAMSIGTDILGFTVDQIGLHSARSGSAMAMYLSVYQYSRSCCWEDGQVMPSFATSINRSKSLVKELATK